MKEETKLYLMYIIALVIGVIAAIKFSEDDYTLLILLIPYQALMYDFFKHMQNNIYSKKLKKVLILDEYDNDEMLQLKINNAIEDLSLHGFIVIDLKILTIKKFGKITKQPYILYN